MKLATMLALASFFGLMALSQQKTGQGTKAGDIPEEAEKGQLWITRVTPVEAPAPLAVSYQESGGSL